MSAACGGSGNQSSGIFEIDIIEPSCTTGCVKKATNTAALQLTTTEPSIELIVKTRTTDLSLAFSFPGEASGDPMTVTISNAQPTFMPVTFACDGIGGTLIANAAEAENPRENTDSPGVEIQCPGAAIETANVVATAQISVDQAGTETPTKYGGVKLIGGSTTADRDLARDALLKAYRDTPVGECKVYTYPGSPTLVYQDVPANTEFAKVGGGAPLTFAAGTGFLTSTPELGVSYDATIAASGPFIGFTAPGLSAMPPLPGGFNGGVLVTSGNLMGEASPGYNLGNFTPSATTMPSFSWAAPSPAVTDIIVRIFDRSENDPSPATTTICRLPPTATSWTMPMPVFTALTLNSSSMNYDVTSIDLYFANIAVAPVTIDEAFLNVSEARLKNIFLRKKL